MRKRMLILSLAVLAIAAVVGAGIVVFRYYFAPRTVASVLARYGRDARSRLKPSFDRAHVAYPPKRLALLVFKNERRLAVWAADNGGRWRYIRDYSGALRRNLRCRLGCRTSIERSRLRWRSSRCGWSRTA